MTARPLLFLDIDGVLNPVLPTDGFTAYDILDFTVLLSVTHADWLRELSATYELVWATTWEHEANRHIAPLLELPRLPVVEFTGYEPRPDDPKLPVLDLLSGRKWAPILRYAAGRPFAWVDDVMPERLVTRSRLRRDRLLLPVDPAHGLRREHVDRLLRRPPRARRLRRPRPHRRPTTDGPSVLNVPGGGATVRSPAAGHPEGT
ncbi:HAD domain-containing protein [Streptomyces sp. NPDC007983]|uniref:HAD domain-containing protein n=1 Tax=Streptomyces sp. NPDC007983 TaxID=3364800 RepID=UPI0036E4FEF8